MKTRKTLPAFEPSEAEIQHTAHLLWLESGQQPGHDLEHWFAAKELLRHRHATAGSRTAPSPIPPAVPTTS